MLKAYASNKQMLQEHVFCGKPYMIGSVCNLNSILPLPPNPSKIEKFENHCY